MNGYHFSIVIMVIKHCHPCKNQIRHETSNSFDDIIILSCRSPLKLNVLLRFKHYKNAYLQQTKGTDGSHFTMNKSVNIDTYCRGDSQPNPRKPSVNCEDTYSECSICHPVCCLVKLSGLVWMCGCLFVLHLTQHQQTSTTHAHPPTPQERGPQKQM